jgi:hypothetical protein
LVTAQILAWLGQQRLSLYRFRHQLFQHYVYHNLTDMERTYLHEAVGNVLEAIYGGQTEPVAVQLARHFEQIAALYNPEQHRPLTFQYGQDPGMAGLSAGALDLWLLGYPDQARHWNDRALTLGREASHAHTLAFALDAASWFHQFCQERAVAQERAEAAIASVPNRDLLCGWLGE